MKMKRVIIGIALLLSVFLAAGCVLVTKTSSDISGQKSQTSSILSSTASSTGSTISQASSSMTSSASSASSSSSAEEKTLTGIFEEVETGDYMHLYMQGDDGVQYSFFILHNVGVGPETLVPEQRITVTWRNIDIYQSEISQTINMDEITKIELVK